MAALEAFKADLIIPRNMWTRRGNGHGAGTATWLTGHGYDGRRINAGGTSADQIAAGAIGQETLLPSLELSLEGEGYFSNSLVRNTISWSIENTPVPRDTEPRVVFDRMFRAATGGFSDRSVLDSVLEDVRDLRLRVSTDDQRKIDEYLASIRAIERRIDFADKQSNRAAQQRELASRLVRPPAGIPADSMVLYGSSLADGHAHAEKNLPLLLAGRGGDTIDSGRQVKYDRDTSLSDMHLAILQRIGVKIDRFGGSTRPMSELNQRA